MKKRVNLKKSIVEITIEEHLSKTIKIEVPNNLENAIDRETYAYEKIKDMYQNEEIVLDSSNFNGTVLYQSHDINTDEYSEWTDLF